MQTESIYQVFNRQTQKAPDAIAVTDDRRSLTYAELSQLADSIAAELPAKSKLVGIVMDHSVEMIASMLAVLNQ